jgi:hypothetical protein
MTFTKQSVYLGALFVFGLTAYGQITGSVRGTVVDPADVPLGQGTVTIRNLDTGAERQPQALTDGTFVFELLPIGRYSVTVTANGFRTATATAEVKAGEITALRIPMEVGTVTETITVTEAATLLDTQNSQIQVSYTAAEVQAIPVARNPNLLAITSPGTVPVSANNPFLGSGSFNVNGQRGRSNNITIDGITATDISVTGTGGTLTPLNFASIAEVKTITNVFSAEYGRNMGSQVIYLTRSGTNQIHGELYELLRNNVLNARPFFDTTGKANIVRRNEYGFTVGGPAWLPFYDGRDKTFWNFDWGQIKLRGASAPVIANVPTPAMIAQVTDPSSLALLNQYKLPTSPTGQLGFSAPNSTDTTLWGLRGDQNFGSNGKLFVRYSRSNSETASPGLTFIQSNLPGFGARSAGKAQYATAGYTHAFSPVIVNETRFGFGQSKAAFPIDTPYALGPRIQFADASVDRFGVWEGLPQGREQRTYQTTDNFSWTKGQHTLKFGGEWYHLQADSEFDSLVRGVFTFASWADFARGVPQSYSQRFGNSQRNFRINNFFAFAQDDWKVNRNLTLNLGVRMEWAGGPVEKNGRISNLNFLNRSPMGAAGSGVFGTLEVGKPSFNSNTNWAPRVGFAWSSNDLKTVIRGGYGIAYDFVFLNPITNQRFLPPLMYTGAIAGQASFTGNNSMARILAGTSEIQTQTAAQVGTISQTALNFGAISPAINQDLRNPQAHMWNLGVQRQLAGLVFKLSYVGTKGNYLPRSRDINLIAQPVAPAVSVADETARLSQFQAAFAALTGSPTRPSNRIDPRFNAVVFVEDSANSNYHSMQFEVQKRVRSFTLNANWTWGHSIDDGSDVLGVLINDSPNQQNPLNNRDNRGPSQFDIRHRVVITHNWELPWFKNASNPWLKHTLGGWGFSGITSFRTGFPTTLEAGVRRGISPIPNIGGGAQVRPNATGPLSSIDFRPAGSAGAPSGTTNPDGAQAISAFAARLGLTQPLLGNFGNLGRGVFRLNGERNFDWNVYKRIRIQETRYLELRGEIYNVFNNTAFQEVNRNITNTNFGQYTSVSQDARLMQVGARFVF